MNQDLSNINRWLYGNKLSLNITKMEFMLIVSRTKLITMAAYPKINVNGQPVTKVDVSKSLGLHIDNTPSWNKHTDQIIKRYRLQSGP